MMTIQINTDNNLPVHETYHVQLKEVLSAELSRFEEHITRLEMHLNKAKIFIKAERKQIST